MHKPVLLLQRERRVKFIHDTYSKRGSVVSTSSRFTNPPEDKYITGTMHTSITGVCVVDLQNP